MGQALSKVKEDFAASQKEAEEKIAELQKKVKRKAGGLTTFIAWLAFLLGILALVVFFVGKGGTGGFLPKGKSETEIKDQSKETEEREDE